MTALLWSLGLTAILLLLPVPFVKRKASRHALAFLSLFVLALGGMAYALTLPRSQPLNFAIFAGLLGLFWLASRFEAR